jgi:hypothetical protein
MLWRARTRAPLHDRWGPARVKRLLASLSPVPPDGPREASVRVCAPRPPVARRHVGECQAGHVVPVWQVMERTLFPALLRGMPPAAQRNMSINVNSTIHAALLVRPPPSCVSSCLSSPRRVVGNHAHCSVPAGGCGVACRGPHRRWWAGSAWVAPFSRWSPRRTRTRPGPRSPVCRRGCESPHSHSPPPPSPAPPCASGTLLHGHPLGSLHRHVQLPLPYLLPPPHASFLCTQHGAPCVAGCGAGRRGGHEGERGGREQWSSCAPSGAAGRSRVALER